MTVLMLDAYNLVFRAFTSLPASITDKDGAPIHAVYGLLGTIIRLGRELEAESMVAAFDDPTTPTFRGDLFPRYQAQRGPMGGENAEDFSRQIAIARDILPSVCIPSLMQPGFEADDILGTMAVNVAREGGRAIVVSTDRDLLQLVRTGVEVYAPVSPALRARDANEVMARMGVLPSGIPDFKALAGDASDNVPGIAGIGAKTAAGLVNEFGSLEGIFGNLESLPRRARNALAGQQELAIRFRTVCTVVTDLEIPLAVKDISPVCLPESKRVHDILVAAGHVV